MSFGAAIYYDYLQIKVMAQFFEFNIKKAMLRTTLFYSVTINFYLLFPLIP